MKKFINKTKIQKVALLLTCTIFFSSAAFAFDQDINSSQYTNFSDVKTKNNQKNYATLTVTKGPIRQGYCSIYMNIYNNSDRSYGTGIFTVTDTCTDVCHYYKNPFDYNNYTGKFFEAEAKILPTSYILSTRMTGSYTP